MLYLEDGMYSYEEMSFESHVSVQNIMLGLQGSMISSTLGFLFFIDWKCIVSTLSGSEFFDVWESFFWGKENTVKIQTSLNERDDLKWKLKMFDLYIQWMMRPI
jgi:hypothetical protein